MYPTKLRISCAVASSFLLCANSYGASAIGQVSARGPVRVDQVPASETATVFEGSRIETAKAASELTVGTGSRYLLASDSGARVFRDRIVLERGAVEARGSQAEISAAGLSLRPGAQGGIGRVRVLGADRIVVEAVNAPATVYKGTVIIASLRPGSPLQLSNATGSNQTKITGKVVKSNGKYYVVDEATRTRFEVKGDVAKYEAKRVELKGNVSTEGLAPGAPPVLVASEVIALGAAAGAAAAGGAAAGGATAGTSAAVIAGVAAVTATGVGLGIGLTRGEEDQSTVSR